MELQRQPPRLRIGRVGYHELDTGSSAHSSDARVGTARHRPRAPGRREGRVRPGYVHTFVYINEKMCAYPAADVTKKYAHTIPYGTKTVLVIRSSLHSYPSIPFFLIP
jgi:hypothetical protein